MSLIYRRQTQKPHVTVEKLWLLDDPFDKHFHRSAFKGRTVWGRSSADAVVRLVVCILVLVPVGAAILASILIAPLWLALPLAVSITLASAILIWFVMKVIPLRARSAWLSDREFHAEDFVTEVDKVMVELFAHMYGVPVDKVSLDDSMNSLRRLHRFWRPPLECELVHGLGLAYGYQYESDVLERVVHSTVDQRPRVIRDYSISIGERLKQDAVPSQGRGARAEIRSPVRP